ncbi:MAG: isoleucine--tRNA ligase [Gemmatimonadetes bacterium]|uniref:Isoleucine--tRNA ligase n=1 Tax=Candidatus Kutchimonas denitrificans TaxID=3056748 RepID=A0AAE4Z8A2_9BACT|nr:isoleucine--tRNA ligase [Gemmatimonadota bacterium]NIR74517.1 isoleucine--tRNA ligase [Candidatus Kutchimonas denitrificans]NIS02707.1 isoleucine--tRNA ligase [Gemmatimonadota bacterium]NIT68868.1 isoleucine--tRNA ligase [Gemmatimonadota bacterium]NIU52173.1 isoleucine--tRNA ligase [Gemmatimonadota bacterium]
MSDKLYREIPENPNELEEDVLAAWERENTFQRSLEVTSAGEPFVFYEGPPTANGRPGIHHIIARTLKDTFCRYHTMLGRSVTRLAGWDTHGLPVEVEAEKALGISGKPEIEKVGIEKFTQVAREHIFTYKEDWEKLSQRIGFWLDYSRAYITFSANYVESVWWALSRFHEKGLLYRGHKVVPFCPRCGTGLSSHEVALGYEDVTEPAVTVKFPIEGRPGEYLLAWTTTPWTLPGNIALAVSPMIAYVRARVGDAVFYVAERRAEDVLGEEPEVLETMPGGDLAGLRYEPPFPYLADAVGRENGWFVAEADFVTAEEGTGIVHTAVMYGQDDYELGVELGLPMHHLVDEEGRFKAEVEPWAGVFVKDADPQIIEALRESGRLLETSDYTHSYPFCWRCSTPLLYYARDSWYLRTTAVKDGLLANNASVNWHPPEIGRGRMAEWLENNVDWALSRDRYWGTPLPVWICDRDAGHIEVIGNYEALAERAGIAIDGEFDPHKPYIDELSWKCGECGGTMNRTPEVIDTWFDSGAMPFSQWHYPMENQDAFDTHFPADFIAEGVDQTRGWFYSLLAISTVLFDRSPYRNVVVNDLVLDAEGVKMSKSRGNVVDPWDAIAQFGADAIRYYLLAVSNPWLPKRYDPKAISEVRRRFFSTLTATYRFFELYANTEAWRPDELPPIEDRPLMDRWLLSRLDALTAACADDLRHYDVTHAIRRIGEFVVDDLSNWYVRRSRARFWGTRAASRETMNAAFATLHEALVAVCRLLAPMAPFHSEWIHRELTGGSVHLERYPVPAGRNDALLDEAMTLTRRIAGLGRGARDGVGIKVRQPLRVLYVSVPGGRPAGMSDEIIEIASDELNVHKVEFVAGPEELVTYRAEPNFAALGPRFGGRAQEIGAAIRKQDSDGLVAWRQEGGDLDVDVDEETVQVPAEAVTLVEEPREGLAIGSEAGVVVGLDTRLDDELRREGTARELINRIQRLRREAGLELDDRIRLGIFGAPEVATAAEAHRDYIAGEVLAVEVEIGPGAPGGDGYEHLREIKLDGREAVIGVEVS